MRRFTGHTEEWGRFLDVKINAPAVLDKQLTTRKKKGIILIGSVTDAYQPVEKQYGITRDILKILAKHEFPVSILTKSALVKRDIDIIKQINSCEVGMTITSLNEAYSKIFEPAGSAPQERLDTLLFFKDNKIKTYAFIGPILPGVTEIDGILLAVKNRVDYVMFEFLNLTKANRDKVAACYKKSGIVFDENLFDWGKIEKKALEVCKKENIPVKGFYKH
jgi:DNA repair photolyase